MTHVSDDWTQGLPSKIFSSRIGVRTETLVTYNSVRSTTPAFCKYPRAALPAIKKFQNFSGTSIYLFTVAPTFVEYHSFGYILFCTDTITQSIHPSLLSPNSSIG